MPISPDVTTMLRQHAALDTKAERGNRTSSRGAVPRAAEGGGSPRFVHPYGRDACTGHPLSAEPSGPAITAGARLCRGSQGDPW